MQTSKPQGLSVRERVGIQPAGRVLDWKNGKKKEQTSQETVQVVCGLCQFHFERVSQPTHLVLVCPSCGVRFEHRLPEPPPKPEKNFEESLLATPLPISEAAVRIAQFRERILERQEESPLEPLSPTPDPFVHETPEIPVVPAKEYWSDPKSYEENPVAASSDWPTEGGERDGRLASALITIAQSILIVAALIGLAGGVASIFENDTKSVARSEAPPLENIEESRANEPNAPSVIRETSPVPAKAPSKAPLEEKQVLASKPAPQTVEPAKKEPTKPTATGETGVGDLPLFEIADLPNSSSSPSVAKTDTKKSSANSVVNPSKESVKPAENGFAPQNQLQSKLAESEKKVQALEQRYQQTLREQGQIRAQSKKLVGETLLRESVITLEKNPTRSLFLALESIQTLHQIGQKNSDMGRTILARSLAAQNQGETFIDRIPTVEAQSVSANGKWLLTSNSDRSLWIWDLTKAGKNQPKDLGFRIDVSQTPVVDLLLTPDEHWVVGARSDGLVEMWNMAVDRPSEASIVLRDRIPGLCRLEISPDGRWLVAYGNPFAPDRTTSVGDRGQGRIEETSETDSPIQTVSYQAETTRSMTNGGNPVDWNGVWMWDLNQLKQGSGIPKAVVLRGHERPIRCLTISPDSRWLATGSDDRCVRVFDLKSTYPGGNQKVLLGHQLEITGIQFARDGQWIATGSRDNTVRVWDLRTETVSPTPRILRGHNGWISSIAVSPDGKLCATAGYDQSVRLWNTQSISRGNQPEKESLLLLPEQGTVQKVAFSPDSATMVTFGSDRSVKVWDMTVESIADHAVALKRDITSFSFGENGRWLVLTNSRGNQSSVSLWPLKFDDLVTAATRYKDTSLPNDLRQREESFAKQFEQRIVR